MTIHWAGTGLSSIPGLRRLIAAGQPVVVWNRTVDKARAAVGDLTGDIRAYTPDALAQAVQPGDIVVSMLPADQHPPIAAMCVDKGAHFVSSSYVSPAMAELDDAARAAGVALVNEVGLDPGIDHLMAHELVADYRQIAQPGDVVRFTSYCGGVPKHPNPFRYKFSWSPLGVLRALKSPSKSLKDGQVLDVSRPWDAITPYDAPLPVPERFEVYPNRDSLPFVQQYGFDPAWDVSDFVRGTIRLKGWQDAWTPVFTEIESLTGAAGEARLREMADQFWRDNSYAEGEPDRVVLFVALRAERDGAAVFDKEWVLDAHGNANGSAMAQLVSTPVALAVQAVAAGRIAPGVHAAPHDPVQVADWLVETGQIAQHMAKVDHLAHSG
ncbi:MAG: saccharopine dehydrogenase C-terminal domain-containing protein [Paracoccus sp. (in: a-proteobacteria)]|uniref:saccharopine dehydrogenase C-terminal domain-containing protein n=1 Tax=Paracoccus sp. TaxID=267 RepID=UPI0026DF738A|nr:saccharopine dehydrogenase C-terminal domain-containing protein [Paracoccus sp. (in: a-proteobacteria)]MDO5612634.1 saccharopine dehydrogenase C-terminal domain-containing protein [Paracoccus sp. (in: a-proteobacteria)]